MAITIEQLDNEYIDQNISILVGKSFILKFIPKKSVYDSNESLKKFINTPDLLKDPLGAKVRALVGLSKEISDLLSESIKTREMYSGVNDSKPDFIKEYLSNQLKEQKTQIINKGETIQRLEKENNLYLAQENNLYFCKSCNAYLGDSLESLPENCLSCNAITNWSDAQNIVKARFLDNKVSQYLNGLWFEDYIAKLLNKLGWKTWCHGSIMGSSGIPHQVDILAINTTDGRVLIGECKTAKIQKEHVFDLSAQFNDIKSCYAFLFSYDTVFNDRLVEYMKRTAGLCLVDNLKANADDQIIEKIGKKIEV